MEKLKILKKKAKNGEGEWTSAFSGESKVTAELKKLTNSPGWVAATKKTLPSSKSPASSRASTPVSTSSKGSRRPKKKKKSENEPKKKKFKMVLEKDEEFEVDYVSPEEEDNTEESDSQSKEENSDDSDDNFSLGGEEDPEDDVSSLDNGSIHLDEYLSENEMDEDFPPLELPESSKDLLIPNGSILPVLGIYETLRHFRSLLRISPMLFEDFCASLADEGTNILLTECYISVLKAILREEDAAGVQFGPPDQKDSKDVALNFLDHMTWPEVVRAYLESTGEHDEVLNIVKDPKFPRVNVEGKVAVLKTLTDIYLASNKIRDKLMTDGVIHYDDHCRVCHKLGDLLCCETCPAVYHLACCDPPLTEVPDDEWQCEICAAHKLNGVYNCEPQHEFKGQYLRHEPIGADRHGNKYWFLVRRIIVEGSEKVWYYSTAEQFQVLLSLLDPERYETMLCEALEDIAGEFRKQAKITEVLTEEALPDDKTTMYLTALKARVKSELEEKRKKSEEEKKTREEEDLNKKEEAPKEKEIEKQQQDVKEEEEKPMETSEGVVNTDSAETSDSSTTMNTASLAQPTEVSNDKEQLATAAAVPSPLTTESQPVTSVPASHESTPVTDATVASPVVPAVTPNIVTVPLTSKTIQGQNNPVQFIKLGANVPAKTVQVTNQPGTASATPVKPVTPQLKTLYVLNKDGTKTQITLGPSGKLATASTPQNSGNRQILVLNSAKVALPKVNRELKKLQFTGAGPKTADILSAQENIQTSGRQLRQQQQPPTTQSPSVEQKEPVPPVIPKKKLTHDEEADLYFRLGEDKAYQQYMNHYTENTLALNKYQHKEERDRERYLSYKFSLSGEGEFKWIGDILGSESTMLETLRSTLMHLEHQIPLCFMHSKWDRYRNAWGKMVMTNGTPQGFAAALGILEMATRTVVKRSVWRTSHGLPRLKRVTASEKEEWDKKRKHRSRADEDEGNRNAVWCKYPFPIKSTMVWKVRGEEYRLTAYGGWIWISTTRQSKLRPYQPKPFTFVADEKKDTSLMSEIKVEAKCIPESQSGEKTSSVVPEADSDSEKSSSTTSTTTTKSADLTEDRGVFETLVQEATKTEPIVTSSTSATPSSSASTSESSVTSLNPSATSTTADDTPLVKSELDVSSSKDSCDDIINACDVINISENLLKRTAVYKKKWAASRVDVLLGWRMVQKDKEAEATKDSVATSAEHAPVAQTNPVTVTTDIKKPTDVTMATSVADSTLSTSSETAKQAVSEIKVDNKVLTTASSSATTSTSDANSVITTHAGTVVKEQGTNQIRADDKATAMSAVKMEPEDQSTPPKNCDVMMDTSTNQGYEKPPKSSLPGDSEPIESPKEPEHDESAKVAGSASTNHIGDDTVNTKQEPLTGKVIPSMDQKVSGVIPDGIKVNTIPEESSESRVTPANDAMIEVKKVVTEAEGPLVDIKTGGEVATSGSGTTTITTCDSVSLVDSVVETTKTTITDSDETVTVVETHATTVTKTTTITKTVASTSVVPCQPKDSELEFSSVSGVIASDCSATANGQNETKEAIKTEPMSLHAFNSSAATINHASGATTNTLSATTNGPNVTQNLASTSECVSNTTTTTATGAKLFPQTIQQQRPELLVALPRIEFGKGGKASIVTQQVHTARLSRMSRARRVIRQARDGPLATTQKVWKLERCRKSSAAAKKEMKLPLPWKFCVGKQKKKSIFRLPASAIRKIARRGGQYAYRAGFTFGAKWFSGLEQFWLYPCPRPTFSLAWRYKLQNVTTFASAAHLLRTFWHVIKWDKMTMRPQTDDVAHTVTTDDEIITTELLKRKDDLTTGLHSEYFIRRIRMPILDPEEEALRAIKPAEGYTPSRKGLRSSRRSASSNRPRKDSEPQVQTIWVPEEQVELWQIRQFDTLLKQQQQNHSQPKVAAQGSSILHNGSTTFITTPSGGILPTLQNIKSSKIESEVAGPGFSIVRLPLHQNAQLIQKSTSSPQTPQAFLNTKTILGKSPVQKIIVQPQTQFSQYKQAEKQQAVIRSTAGGTQYIVQGGRLVKPIIIKAGSQIVTTPIQSAKPAVRMNDQAIKFQQQPPLLPTLKKTPPSVAPKTSPQQQTQIKLSTAQLQQLLRVGSATPIRVSVTLGNGRTGVGQIQLIAPGSQVTPSAGQQLMQTRVGGVVKKFLFTLIAETSSTPAAATTSTPPPANEVSLQTASLSQRLQQIQRQQLLGRNRNTDMKRLLTDKDPLWGSKPQAAERPTSIPAPAPVEPERPKKKPLSRVQREEGQRQTVVAQVMKSILDRIEHKEKIELRNKKREEAILKQKERKEQSEQAKVHNRQTQFLHKHRDHLKQEILKRRAIVEKYLTHTVKNELREDQRKHRRGGSGSDFMSSPTKRAKKNFGSAPVSSTVLKENNEKRKQAVAKKRHITSPPPPQETKKQKMINTKKKDMKLYCVCKTPYDPTKFYIGCDLCLNWFHGSCVDIPEERAKFMSEWICDECSRAKEEPAQELYCLCRTPYDDSKFYIGCDICQDWYHGDCVGIAEKDADKIDFYACPRCKNKKKGAKAVMEENLLTTEDHVELTKVIRSLRSHKMAWPFLRPVSKFEVPNYHKVIKKPMDLGTVMDKLPSYNLLSELMGDVSLIFDNCRLFNGAESPLTRCAEIVESVFVGKMREYRGKRKTL